MSLNSLLHEDSIPQRRRMDELDRALKACVKLMGGLTTTRQYQSLVADLVNEKAFRPINLAREVQQAEAWLIQTGKVRRNVRRFLFNWLRRASTNGSRGWAQNANPAPVEGKYDHLHRK